MSDPSSYRDFWPRYLAAHRRPGTRALHYLGTLAGTALLVFAGATLDWRYALAAPLVGYGLAWIAHLAIEKNRPQTFGHPLWSFISDYRLCYLWATGRLDAELDRLGL